jgi:glycosyltransferase involved in cell wall biosynthesis
MKVCRISRPPLEKVTRRFSDGRFNNISLVLQSRGHEVVELEISTHYSANPYISYTLGILALPFELRRIHPQLLIADTPEAGIAALISKFIFRLPLVFDFKDDYSLIAAHDGKNFRHRMIQWLEKKLPALSDQVIVVTREMEEFCLDNGVSREKLHHVSNGVDTGVFFPLSTSAATCDPVKADKEKIVLYRGKMNEYYRVGQLLKAFSSVIRKAPGTRFLMVGDGKDLSDFKESSVKLGIEKAVQFTGLVSQEQLNRYINLADVCVYPIPNSTGLAVMEYAACAKPVVIARGGTAKIGNSHELVSRELVCRADDSVEGFTTAICDLLENPKKASTMGQAAYRLVVEHCAWTTIATKYEKVLLAVVKAG